MHAPLTAARTWSQADFLDLQYRADLNLLVGRWQRTVSDAELRQGYHATLRAAQEVGCPFWQLDIRGRQAPQAHNTQWLMEEFVPQLTTQLDSRACLGYLLRPSHLMPGISASTADSAVYVAFFSEEGPLTAWLAQCQYRSRATLVAAGFRPPPLAA
jgi:hypothetical protein